MNKKKLKLPRGKMPPPMKIHKDKKKEESKRKCRKSEYWERVYKKWNKLIEAE